MKTRDEIAEIILDEFRRTNCRVHHIVQFKVFRFSILPKLNPKEQDLFSEVVQYLIDEGYFNYEKRPIECFRLMQKGFDYIYPDNSEIESKGIIRKIKLPSTEFPDEVYRNVIETITNYGKDLETKPNVYTDKSEEELRDHFLSILTSRYERTTVTGETFNKSGKTDIILKDDKGNNLFIAECKWWSGVVDLHSAINQLFDNYITWRDTRLAIINFVRNKDFTNVLNQIENKVKTHKYYISYSGDNNKTNFSFIFRQKDDDKNKVNLELIFFHFPKI